MPPEHSSAPNGGGGFTPGPWQWFGNQHGLYLATTHSGRRYVMGFRRMGMQGAQPAFQVSGRMVEAAKLVQFEVGDGTARGFDEGKADDSVYRYDVCGIDCADARLIACAPELLEELEQQADGTSTIISLLAGQTSAVAASLVGMLRIQEQSARAAITKATAAAEQSEPVS